MATTMQGSILKTHMLPRMMRCGNDQE
uniref:Uncharacterized protein n=1 Tax=Arundo donax TaxID=35708 RepID=A0A0A8YXU3_ARUDO